MATISKPIQDVVQGNPVSATYKPKPAEMTTLLTEMHGPDHDPIVVFAWGQSNMRGFVDSTDGDKTLDPEVFFWNQNAFSTPMVAGTQWLPAAFGTAPLNITPPTYTNNAAFAFAKRLRERTGRPVYVMQIAVGSHHIESFIKAATRTANGWALIGADQDLSTFMYPGLATALAAVPGAPTMFDYVIGLQGEANQDEQVEIYAAKMVAMFTDLAASGLVDLDSTPFAHADLLESSGNQSRLRLHSALVRAQESLPTLRIVPTAGLPPTGTNGVHYTGEGLVTLGGRLADAMAAPPLRVDFGTEPVRFGADYGFLYFTPNATQAEGDIANRSPVAYSSTLTIENNASLGWCYVSAANSSRIVASRRLFPVPKSGAITVALEAITAAVGATIDIRLMVYQYDKSKVFTASKTFIPPNSPLTDVMGRTVYRARFGRSTVEADMALDATCEFYAYAVMVGLGGDDEAVSFNILEFGQAPFVSSIGAAGQRLSLESIDLLPKMTAPAVIAGAATLTNANLQTTVISYTGAAATVTFPTGATLESIFAATDTAFEFSVINTGSGAATMTANTGVTILGAAAVAAATSARWALRRTAASTYVAYRLS